MKTFGEIAYIEYCDHRKWKSVHNDPLPAWREQFPELQEAWEAAAKGAIEEYERRKDDD